MGLRTVLYTPMTNDDYSVRTVIVTALLFLGLYCSWFLCTVKAGYNLYYHEHVNQVNRQSANLGRESAVILIAHEY